MVQIRVLLLSRNLCMFSLLALVNAGSVFNYKRHYTNTNSGGDRATRSPHSASFCRDVCTKVNQECSDNCYPPMGTAHTIFSTTWYNEGVTYSVQKYDSPKYACFDNCLKQDSDPYLIPTECSATNDSEIEEPIPTKKSSIRVDTSRLTTEERCKLPAYKNSTVCKFEVAQPDTARKVYEANKPKLSLCTSGTVMSGNRGLYTLRATKSFTAQQHVYPSAGSPRSRQGRSGDTETGFEKQRKKRVKRRTKRQAKRVDDNITGSRELCVTDTRIESPSKALHQATNTLVDIYFFAGHSQWFEMGTCKDSVPLLTVTIGNRNVNARCAMAYTAHRAYILIDSTIVKNLEKFRSCKRIPQTLNYLVCWDWVYLPSHCKLFFS